jgi:hypothetical protein
MPDWEAIELDWKDLAAKTVSWRDMWAPSSELVWYYSKRRLTPDMLQYDSQCISFIHLVRLTCLVQRLPSPLNPQHRVVAITINGLNLMRQAAHMIEVFNQIPQQNLSTLPAYIMMIFAVAVMLARRSLTYIQKVYPEASNLDIKEVNLSLAEDRMKRLGGLARKALHLVDEGSGGEAPATFQDPMFPANGPATLPFDFDFSSFFDAGLPDGFWDLGANDWNRA